MKAAVSEIGNHPQAIKPQVFNTLEPDARRLMVAIATKFWSGNMTKKSLHSITHKKSPAISSEANPTCCGESMRYGIPCVSTHRGTHVCTSDT